MRRTTRGISVGDGVLHDRPLGERLRRPLRPFAARHVDQLVVRSSCQPESDRGDADGQGAEEAESVQGTVDGRNAADLHPAVAWHHGRVDPVVDRARAPEATHSPAVGVERHVVGREQDERSDGAVIQRRGVAVVVDDQRATADPCAVVRPGTPLPPTRDLEPVSRSSRAAHRRSEAAGVRGRVAVDGLAPRLGERPRDQRRRRGDHRTPRGRSVPVGELLESFDGVGDGPLAAADLDRGHGPSEPERTKALCQVVGQAAERLDLGGPGSGVPPECCQIEVVAHGPHPLTSRMTPWMALWRYLSKAIPMRESSTWSLLDRSAGDGSTTSIEPSTIR